MSKRKKDRRNVNRRFLGHEILESRSLLTGSPWQNPLSCNDLNDDGAVSPADALLAINSINSGGSGQLSGRMTAPTLSGTTSSYLDANGDGSLSPVDPLMVINALNGGSETEETDTTEELPTEDQQPDEIGDDVPALELSNGFARVKAALNADGDVDVFGVTAEAVQLHVALFTRVSGDVTISIVDAEGEEIGAASTADSERHRPAVLNVTVEAGSSYFILVSGASEVTGGYCLQVINNENETPPAGDDETGDRPERLTPAELFAKLDADSDGGLTLEEFSALPAPKHSTDTPEEVFTGLDADASGALNEEEFTTLFTAREEDERPRPPHGPGGPDRRPSGERPTAEQIFAKLDADDDESLSVEELKLPPGSTASVDEVFAAWDTDTSGGLSVTEFTIGLATLKAR